jgi:exonuclease VII large subunit
VNTLNGLTYSLLALALFSSGAFVAWEWQANRYASEIASLRTQAAENEAERSRVVNEAITHEQQRNAHLTEALSQLEQHRFALRRFRMFRTSLSVSLLSSVLLASGCQSELSTRYVAVQCQSNHPPASWAMVPTPSSFILRLQQILP